MRASSAQTLMKVRFPSPAGSDICARQSSVSDRLEAAFSAKERALSRIIDLPPPALDGRLSANAYCMTIFPFDDP